MNPMNGIRRNFIHEMLPTALICQSKASKVVVQSTESVDAIGHDVMSTQ